MSSITGKDINGQISNSMGLDWRKKVQWDNNCIYEGSGAIVKFYDAINGNSSIDSESEWNIQWRPHHPNDVHTNPLFKDIANEDFTLRSNSPVQGIGYSLKND